MATGHFYLTSNSPGAPALNDTAGSLISVLDFILDIGGVGAYWEKVYTGTNKAAYRATTGQRYYLRVEDFGHYSRHVGYETMSDVDTGTEPFPNTDTDFPYFQLFHDLGAGDCPWWAVGDSRFFALFITPENITNDESWKLIYCFGEVNPFDSLDAYCTVLVGEMTDYTGTSESSADNGPQFLSRSYFLGFTTAAGNASNQALYWANLPDGTLSCIAGRGQHFTFKNSGNPVLANQPAVPILPIHLNSGDGATVSSSTRITVRGRLPYIYTAPLRWGVGVNDNDTIVDGADEYVVVGACDYTAIPTASTQTTYLIRTSNNEPGRV